MTPKVERLKTTELAEKFVRAGKLPEAIAEYEKLLEGDVQDINVINIVGDLQVRLGEDKEAIRSFQKVAGYYERKGQSSQALAIYKKINKLVPENTDVLIKLADLYSGQGFQTEAKAAYLKIVDKFGREARTKEAIPVYEKLVKLNREDMALRLTLADLYKNEGMTDQAVDELNDVAEFRLAQNDLKEAERVLTQANKLNELNVRTVTNLVEIYRKKDRAKEAIAFIEQILAKDTDNVRLLDLLGGLYFEAKDFKKAEGVFARVIEERPMDVRARIKLGRIHIHFEELDKAYELFEPLVANLVKKQREEKAIGLLGLILASKKVHLPTLEKLASIYRAADQKKNFEVVSRVLLEEARRQDKREKMLSVLSELAAICPDDEKVVEEYKALRKEFGLTEDQRLEEIIQLTEDDENIIKTNLSQADLYIEQGLVRNARRILENLQMRYIDEPRIAEKIAVLDEMQTKVGDDELALRIERISAREARLLEKQAKEGQPRASAFAPTSGDEPKVIAADIFAETDIVPFPIITAGEHHYFDLRGPIDEENKVISELFGAQAKGNTAVFEKELGEIVQEFRKAVGEKIGEDDYEIHYYLGVAFMEQGLLDEAIDELQVAARDADRTMECYGIIGGLYRQKKEYSEAAKWIEKALSLAGQSSSQMFALKYDLASLYDELKEGDKALPLYLDVQRWDPFYREVTKKIGRLDKGPASQNI